MLRRATWTVGRGQPTACVGTAFRRNRKKNQGLEKIRGGAAAVFKPTKGKLMFLCGLEDGKGRGVLKTKETFGHGLPFPSK